MKKNYYMFIALLLVWLPPLSMQAFGTNPTSNSTTDKTIMADCAGVTVVGGSSNIALAGLGKYSHIIVFTSGFAKNVYDNAQVSTATLNIPMTTAGNYIVKVWSNPDPAAPCENNFNVTVTAGGTGTGGGNICTNTAANIVGGAGSIKVSGITSLCAVVQVFNSSWAVVYNQQTSGATVTVPNLAAGSYIVKVTVLGTGCKWTPQCVVQSTVKVTSGGGTCTEYNISNANDCASGFWRPYSMYVTGVFYQIRDGKFRKNSDGTATLTANYTLDGWSTAATAKVTFTGMTTTTPVGSPKHSICTQGAPTTDWTYYTAFTGTVTINGVAQTISRRGEAFQVGIGANGQNKGDLGASCWFILGNNGLGDFNFRLSGGTSCSVASAYLVKDEQISMRATAETNRSRVEWTNNTGYKNDFFTLEKENPKSGSFETLAIVSNKYASDIHEYYTIYDNAPTEGDNVYRVKVTYVDGISKTSEIQTIKFNATEGIRLYPNPAIDVVGVDLSNYKGQAVTIALYNQFGQQVLTQQIEKASGTVNLDVSQNTTGNYMVRVVSKGRKDVIQQLHIAK
jgi:Secretion system C-terminal sorting domain